LLRLSGIETTRQFAKEKFPESDIVFFAGSASRGEETVTSDLDIVIPDYSYKTIKKRETLITLRNSRFFIFHLSSEK
jgi:predicted nucleotidyltransferase